MRAFHATFASASAGVRAHRPHRPHRRGVARRAFYYDVQEMEDDESRRERERKERAEFKNNARARDFSWEGIDPSAYTLEQLAFISRKQSGIMPDMNDCACCEGIGTLVCTACMGTGSNSGHQADKFDDTVRLNSNALNAKFVEATHSQEGAPCWICRGAKHIACTMCEGSGRRDFAENYICD